MKHIQVREAYTIKYCEVRMDRDQDGLMLKQTNQCFWISNYLSTSAHKKMHYICRYNYSFGWLLDRALQLN